MRGFANTWPSPAPASPTRSWLRWNAILETARESAARTLAPLLAELGFQERDIKITFRKEFTQADLGTLLDKTSMEHANEYDY